MKTRVGIMISLWLLAASAMAQQYTINVIFVYAGDDEMGSVERAIYAAQQEAQITQAFGQSQITNVNVVVDHSGLLLPLTDTQSMTDVQILNWLISENGTSSSLTGYLRNQAANFSGADVVIMFFRRNSGSACGRAYIPNTLTVDNSESHAFAVVKNTAECDDRTTVHELGHVLGAEHTVGNDTDLDNPRPWNHGIFASGIASIMHNISQDPPTLLFSGSFPWLKEATHKDVHRLIREDARIVAAYRGPPPDPTFTTCAAEFMGCFNNRPDFLVTAHSSDAPIQDMIWDKSPNGTNWDIVYPTTECNVAIGQHYFQWTGTSDYFEFLRGQILTYYGGGAYCQLSMLILCPSGGGGGPGPMPQSAGPSLNSFDTTPTDDEPGPRDGRGPDGKVIKPGTVFEGVVTTDEKPPGSGKKGKNGLGPADAESKLLTTLREMKSGT